MRYRSYFMYKDKILGYLDFDTKEAEFYWKSTGEEYIDIALSGIEEEVRKTVPFDFDDFTKFYIHDFYFTQPKNMALWPSLAYGVRPENERA